MKGENIYLNNIKWANDFGTRLKGLMFISHLEGMNGLLIENCYSIHTFFMKMPIDVVFLGHDNKVIKILRNLRPWRMTLPYIGSKRVLEVAANTLPLTLKEGDQLEVLCIN